MTGPGADAAPRDTVLLLGPRRAALSGVSTHLNVLLSSRLARDFRLRHFEVGSEGRDESSVGRALRLIASPFRLLGALLRQRAAIVHLNTALTPRAYWRDLSYMIVATLCGARVLCQIHGGPLPLTFCRGRPLLMRFVRATLRLADAIVVLSRAEREAFRRFVGATPVLAIPHAVDGAPYAALAPRRAVPGAPPLRLLYLGRLIREKGLYELLRGFEHARAAGVAAELAIAGSGAEAMPLQQWITARGLEGVRLVGTVQGADKVAVLGWADVLVLPSYAEGLPYALLESMAAGVPAIATRVGAVPELVMDGVNGLLIEPGDPAAITAAIVRLAGDRQGLASMSEACRAIAAARYSVARLAAQFSGVYAQLRAPNTRSGGGSLMGQAMDTAAEPRGAARSLTWRINRLRCMTAAEILFRLSRLVRAHLERVMPRAAGVPARDRGASLGRWVAAPAPLDAAPYVAAAERIAGGTLSVFSLRYRGAGRPPRWNRDPKTGIEAPLTRGKLLDYRDRRRVGDIRYLWELNRHRHLVTLAQAYALTREASHLRVLREHLESWFSECPCGIGPNWCSALEVAIRLINWSVAWQLIGGADAALFADGPGARFRDRWLASVYRHARFISGHFSRHSSANNHLIGEAAGLYIAGLTWPCWPGLRRWRQRARRILEREALQQSGADGVNLEQSVCYQRFVSEFLLLALLAGRSEGEAFSSAYERRLSSMLAFLAAIMNGSGALPMIGDSDDGIVTQLSQEADFCPYRSLLATGAILFDSATLKGKAGRLDDQTRWLSGPRAEELFAQAGAFQVPPPRRRAFPQGGYYILGCDFDTPAEVQLLADAGTLGYRKIAAHGHADALAFTLSLGGLEFLIDPGTYAYHGGGRWREYFRGTAAHNTVRVDGVDQSRQGGEFMWLRHAHAQCELWQTSDAVDVFQGWHDGYLRLADPVLHRRRIALDKAARRILVDDRLEMAGAHDVELYFHCAEQCLVESAAEQFALHRAPWTLRLRLPVVAGASAVLHHGTLSPPCGWVSRHYDNKQPSPTIVWRARLKGACVLHSELIYRSD